MLTKAELGAELRARREAVLIVNTGSRRGERSFNAARAGLEARGIHVVESYPVRAGAQLPKLVERTIAAGHRLVVVGGGDGTLSSAVGAFAYADAALGVLPLGTGNSFAQTLTIPQDLGHALDIIAGGNVVDVDLGVVNEAYFSNVATIGLSANVARRTPRWLKRILGPAAYVVIGVVQTFQHNAFIATIDDGERVVQLDTHQIIVANGRVFGATPITADAHVDNRSFAIVTLRGKSRWQVARLWLALLSGRINQLHDATGAKRSQCTITTVPPQYIDVDGEVVTQTPGCFSIAAEALRVLVPPTFEEPWDDRTSR